MSFCSRKHGYFFALTLALLLMATAVRGDLVFRDGFEFLPASVTVLLAWEDDADGNGFNDIRAGGTGLPDIDQRINPDAAGEQLTPALAIADNGDFVVAWANDGNLNDIFDIYVRGFNADGSERFPFFTVNTDSAGQQLQPDIAMMPNGDFVVVWMDDRGNDGFGQIYARGFFANGQEKFPVRTLNDQAAGDQRDPVVGMADDGTFVAAWADDQDRDGLYEISARRFSANGAPQLGQFDVNPVKSGAQSEPAISVDANGGFVVAWRDDRDLNFFSQIRASGYDASGAPRFTDKTLNAVGGGNQYHPSVALLDDGSFVATWIDQGQQVMGRAFAVDGTPRFDDLVLNVNRFRPHLRPAITARPDGAFFVAWQELNGVGNWRLRGRSVSLGGVGGAFENFAADREGDQQTASVGVR